jgi:hypothetical protein
MRRTFVVVALLAVWAAVASAQVAEKKVDEAKPISGLEWLVGGVWTADATKLGPGMRRIETQYQWSDNNSFIRFTTHFVSDKGTAKTYDGNFFWNPEQASLAVWYMDHANSITQGPVTLAGDSMKIAFRATDFDGKMGDMQVSVIRKTNDKYRWILEEKQGDGWKQLAALDYLRSAGS